MAARGAIATRGKVFSWLFVPLFDGRRDWRALMSKEFATPAIRLPMPGCSRIDVGTVWDRHGSVKSATRNCDSPQPRVAVKLRSAALEDRHGSVASGSGPHRRFFRRRGAGSGQTGL